jgi:hypothetical protein
MNSNFHNQRTKTSLGGLVSFAAVLGCAAISLTVIYVVACAGILLLRWGAK